MLRNHFFKKSENGEVFEKSKNCKRKIDKYILEMFLHNVSGFGKARLLALLFLALRSLAGAQIHESAREQELKYMGAEARALRGARFRKCSL